MREKCMNWPLIFSGLNTNSHCTPRQTLISNANNFRLFVKYDNQTVQFKAYVKCGITTLLNKEKSQYSILNIQ